MGEAPPRAVSFAWCSIPASVVEKRQLYLPEIISSLKRKTGRGAALNYTQIQLVRVQHLHASSAAVDQPTKSRKGVKTSFLGSLLVFRLMLRL